MRQDVTNKVLIYLLGKEDQPAVAEALKQYYERSVHLSKQWILTGQLNTGLFRNRWIRTKQPRCSFCCHSVCVSDPRFPLAADYLLIPKIIRSFMVTILKPQ